MNDSYLHLVDLLASGARIPSDRVDAVCQKAGVGPGLLVGDVMRRLDLTPPCPCGGRQRVYATKQAADSKRIRHTRCTVCGRRSKVVTTA